MTPTTAPECAPSDPPADAAAPPETVQRMDTVGEAVLVGEVGASIALTPENGDPGAGRMGGLGPVTRARRTVARRIASVVRGVFATVIGSGPVVGAAYVLTLAGWTWWTLQGEDDGRVMGVRAARIVDLARSRFGEDARALTWSLAATAVCFGAMLGVLVEGMVGLREWLRGARPGGLRRFAWRAGGVAAAHTLVTALAIAEMPQLYTGVLYSRTGWGRAWSRTLEVLLTDVLGRWGVVAVGLAVSVPVIVPFGAFGRAFATLRAGAVDVRRLASLALHLAALVLLVSGAGSLGRFHIARAERAEKTWRPNVLILAVDSLRDDRLTRRTAPRLSALADEGTRFTRAYVTLPRTLPSWTTILTGREPHRHGLRTMFPRYDDRARDLAALPSRLHAIGYRSAVVGDYAADIFTRIRYGFDFVDAPTFNFHALIATRALERATPLLPLLQHPIGRAIMPAMLALNQAADPALVARDARRWLARLSGSREPFLLTVFFSTAHFPYAAPAPFYARFTDPAYRGRFKYHKPNVLGEEGALDPADVRQVRGLYDGAVSAVDEAAGEILGDLRARGLDENTIVVVTADHGEMLYENGHGQGHGDHLFGDEVVRVPLAIRAANRRGVAGAGKRTVDDVVRDVDLAPTLLDLVGAPTPTAGDMDGRSLAPLLRGESLPPRPAFAETEVWMTETIPEVPAGGASPMRLPYPDVTQLTELDARLAYDVVMRADVEPLVIAAKHRMVLDGSRKLVYAPTRRGARYFLFDRATDPGETIDIAAAHPDEVNRLRGPLWRWMLGDTRMEERDGVLVPRGEAGSGGASSGGAIRLP